VALTRRAALTGIGYAFAVTMFGTTLPTPLYPLYRRDIGFSDLMVTVIYAVYAVGVLIALLTFGQLSDRVGRRPVLLAGIGLSALSALAFLVQGGLSLLFIGRVLSGLSAGLFTGTATAAMLDLVPAERRARATLAATVVNMGGLGLGPLLAGIISQYVGLPLRTIFIVDLALLVPAALLVLRSPEPGTPAGGFAIRFTRLSVPPEVRAVFGRAALIGFAGFVVLGLFSSVMPSALGELMDQHNRAVIGAVVFAIFLASIVGQVAVPALGLQRSMVSGCVLIVAGMGLLAGALETHSILLLVLAAAVAGLGQGLSFRSGLMLVSGKTPPEQRGEVTSAFFAILYVGISIPVVAVGLAARSAGLQTTGIVTAIIVAGLAVVTLLSLVVRAARSRQQESFAE
jgi:MFS family permease